MNVEGEYCLSYCSDMSFDAIRILRNRVYFLLRTGQVSHSHRLVSDELGISMKEKLTLDEFTIAQWGLQFLGANWALQ